MKKDNFNITVNNGILTISSNHSTESEEKDNGYISREFSYNSFSRSFTLPTDVDDERINANYQNGILHIRLPRKLIAEENTAIRTVLIQ
jgi:HSP20 family protein